MSSLTIAHKNRKLVVEPNPSAKICERQLWDDETYCWNHHLYVLSPLFLCVFFSLGHWLLEKFLALVHPRISDDAILSRGSKDWTVPRGFQLEVLEFLSSPLWGLHGSHGAWSCPWIFFGGEKNSMEFNQPRPRRNQELEAYIRKKTLLQFFHINKHSKVHRTVATLCGPASCHGGWIY